MQTLRAVTSAFRAAATPSGSANFPILAMTAEQDAAPPANQFTDSRDGKVYRTVIMPDGKEWMAENLNWAGAGVYYGSGKTPGNQEPFAKAGRLYTYNEALTAAPPGWHLPSDAELAALAIAVGGTGTYGDTGTAGTLLKAASGWNDNQGASGNGTDQFGWTGLPGGYRNTGGSFNDVGAAGYWWSATQSDASNAYFRLLYYSNATIGRIGVNKAYSFSIRCLKD